MSSSLLEENAWPLLGGSPGYLISRYTTLGQPEHKVAAGLGTKRLSLSTERSREHPSTIWIPSEPAQELFQMVNGLDDSQIWPETQPWSHS